MGEGGCGCGAHVVAGALQQCGPVCPRAECRLQSLPSGSTYTCYATLFYLSASIIYSISYVQFLPYGPYWDRAITATAFSCIASVFMPWVWPSRETGMTSMVSSATCTPCQAC